MLLLHRPVTSDAAKPHAPARPARVRRAPLASASIAMPPSTPPNLDSLGAWLALLTRSSYLLFVAVLLAWFGRLAWFDRETDGAVSFNYHPLFMGLAFVVLMPEALLAYADLEERRGFGHAAAKKMHAWAHIAASVCILLGLIFVFANHSAKGIPALYSAHSWIGLTAAMCTFLQAIVGCVAYALPTLFGVGGESRARLLPAHRFAGAATLALGAAACVAGFVEKQSFTKCAPDASDKRCAALSLVNVLVLLVASTATCALGTVYARWVGGGGERRRERRRESRVVSDPRGGLLMTSLRFFRAERALLALLRRYCTYP